MNDANNYLAKAATEGLTEAIKCLLEAGANPNCPDEVTFPLVFHNTIVRCLTL